MPTRRRSGGWGQYSVDADGALHRTSVSYADELRPLGPAALPIAA